MCFRPPTVDTDIMQCPMCNSRIPAASTECPNCGATEADIIAKGGGSAAPAAPAAAPTKPKIAPPSGMPSAPKPPTA